MNEIAKIEKVKLKEKNFNWISVNKPTNAILENLKRRYKFHELDIEDCLSESQRPKIDDYEDYLFIVLQSPVGIGKNKRIASSEVDIFIGQNFVITLHENNPVIERVFEKCKKQRKTREEYLKNGSGYFLYMIIDDIFASAQPLIDNLNKEINQMEFEVFATDYSKDRLKEILSLKKDIINFRRIIMPQRSLVAQLEHKNKKFLPDDLDVYFDDIVDMVEKMWNSLENLQELINSVQDTNESIISHNSNNIVKILTMISVIMLPLNLITGFYGMNIKLPLAGDAYAVDVIIIVFIVAITGMLSYFYYKKWL
ncbi:MAG: magnesium/cobalt transporter CorA [Patescibacteria group bacterium]